MNYEDEIGGSGTAIGAKKMKFTLIDTIATSQNYSPPEDGIYLLIAIGAGASGGASKNRYYTTDNRAFALGGNGGEHKPILVSLSTASKLEFIIGAGASGANSGTSFNAVKQGNDGNPTIITNYITALGGKGGKAYQSTGNTSYYLVAPADVGNGVADGFKHIVDATTIEDISYSDLPIEINTEINICLSTFSNVTKTQSIKSQDNHRACASAGGRSLLGAGSDCIVTSSSNVVAPDSSIFGAASGGIVFDNYNNNTKYCQSGKGADGVVLVYKVEYQK